MLAAKRASFSEISDQLVIIHELGIRYSPAPFSPAQLLQIEREALVFGNIIHIMT